MERITIHGYDIMVGSGVLDELAQHVVRAAPAHRYVVITDSNVEQHWAPAVERALAAAGVRVDRVAFAAGESSKTRETWARVTDRMLELGLGRDAAVIALGGGVVGDLAGFVAATYMRGIPVVQVPTTLLAMIDSSIGGKTGVDAPAGKNLIGAFHQPALVVIDPRVLQTLPAAEVTNGMAEAIKHGAIADRRYFDSLGGERDYEALITGSVRIKARFVAEDPHEHGARAALNFGHTIGHALELASNYALPHGHAVAMGMVVEAGLGERAGITEPGTTLQLQTMLEKNGLPTRAAHVAPLSTALDKKARAGKTRFVLLARIGDVARGRAGEWTFELDPSLVSAALADVVA